MMFTWSAPILLNNSDIYIHQKTLQYPFVFATLIPVSPQSYPPGHQLPKL